MTNLRWCIVSLTAVAGLGVLGCWRPVGVPPVSAIPNTPVNSPPSALRVTPGVQQRLSPRTFGRVQPQTQDLLGNLWQPQTQARNWNSIVIHHTATDRGNVESIHEAHLKRKDKNGNNWMGIGYHFVIGNGNGMPDGAIEPTFRWKQQLPGAHAGVKDYNEHGIGIALIGNFDERPPTNAQLAAVKQLIATLKAEYGLSSENVIGHNEIRATACPGKFFPLDDVALAIPGVLFGREADSGTDMKLVDLKRSR